MLLASAAHAEDARISYLKKQASAKDARVRAQSCTLLGKTGLPEAVPPLCRLLKDGDAVVRSAAAGALGELRLAEAVDCLKGALGESDSAVRKALQRALDTPVANTNVTPGGLYIAVEPVMDKVGTLSGDVLGLAHELIKQKVTAMGASLAPEGESEAAANTTINRNGMKGFLLRTTLLPNGEKGLKIEVLIMTYPGQSLQGTWNVKASGAKYESLLKVMVPKVVDDAALDLEWK
ncbi:MAG: HEAT repeat domain-containing protein [Archangiaceae bacterium]|nr:HEAT repeat domain-containing protein [Archangiaceae bacterium]